MTKIVHPLLAMIASATDRELARYVEFLKEENRILRARVPGKQVHTKPHERERLLKLGKSLGGAVEELITIVSPSTFYRWMREEGGEPRNKRPKGGQRKPREIRELVLQIARTTGFGYTRIIGELRKLGIKKISRQTVRNILKEEGIQPGPDRASDSWSDFLKRHGESLWGCDSLSVKGSEAQGFARHVRDQVRDTRICCRPPAATLLVVGTTVVIDVPPPTGDCQLTVPRLLRRIREK